jgi:hypothetical protein
VSHAYRGMNCFLTEKAHNKGIKGRLERSHLQNYAFIQPFSDLGTLPFEPIRSKW